MELTAKKWLALQRDMEKEAYQSSITALAVCHVQFVLFIVLMP